MRLLEITNDFPPTVGGIENYVFSLISRWDSDKVVVLTRTTPGSDEFDRSMPFEVRRRNTRVLLPTPGLARQAAEIIRKRGIDIIHFAAPFPQAVLGPRLRRRFGIPYTVSLHGGEFVLASRLPGVRPLVRRSLRDASLLLCESTFVQRHARTFLGTSPPTMFLPAGVDTERFHPGVSPAFQNPRGGPVIVSVSRLVARKGPATLLKSLPRVLASHPDAHALIVGGGPDRNRLERLARRLALEESVTFTGAHPWEVIPSFYVSGEVFCLPTRDRLGGLETEGLPLAYLEAAACGLPSVGGRAGGVGDAVLQGETGYLVDGRSPEQTSTALLRLLDDPELRAQMGQAARRRVERHFTWDRLAAHFQAALEDVTP